MITKKKITNIYIERLISICHLTIKWPWVITHINFVNLNNEKNTRSISIIFTTECMNAFFFTMSPIYCPLKPTARTKTICGKPSLFGIRVEIESPLCNSAPIISNACALVQYNMVWRYNWSGDRASECMPKATLLQDNFTFMFIRPADPLSCPIVIGQLHINAHIHVKWLC